MEEHAFNWLDFIPGVTEANNHVVMAVIIGGLLVVMTLIARLQLNSAMKAGANTADGGLVPEPKMTIRNFFEIAAESLYSLTESVIGHHDAPTYFPIIGTLFIFIFACNLAGLVPGLLPPTHNFNTTLALGAFVFVYYNYAGIRANGMAYFKHFLGPVLWLSPLMLIIEIASHLFRPLSLALRLRGNIMGDHVVLHVFSGLVPYLLPVIFYGLGVFVALIQAFVFCLMTMVYISLSTAHDDSH
jgi:F-type H+-transporting ATPase subunit a